MTPEQAAEIERLKSELQRDLESYKARLAAGIEADKADAAMAQAMLTAATSLANAALRGLLIINGGGAIAVLTFVGNLWIKSDDEARRIAGRMAVSVHDFAHGLIAVTAATILAFLSQTVLHEGRHSGRGRVVGGCLRLLACAVAIASLLFFVRGALSAAEAFRPGG